MDIIISINKPGDITSQDAVTKVKKILKVKKAGHTGTLDPMATGLLLVCVNRATRLASYFSDLDKEYSAVMKLGESTDTQDAYGNVTSKNENIETDETIIKDVLRSFEGKILQQPPMFSALKHKGRSLYTYARKGIEIERRPREVNIRRIELLDTDLPYVRFNALCSKGTYIRTLCHDIGERLGTGAHLYGLQRTGIGKFSIEDSLTFEELKAVSQGESIKKGIHTMDEAVYWMPEFRPDSTMIKGIIHGNPVMLGHRKVPDELRSATGIRIKSGDGSLLAIGSYSEVKNMIKMDVVFN